MLALGEPCLFVEDKVIYTRRMFPDSRRSARRDGGVARVVRESGRLRPHRARRHGDRALTRCAAADRAGGRRPSGGARPGCSRSHLDLPPAAHVVVAEDSTGGGTWGAEVAHHVHARHFADLAAPVTLVHAADTVIPTAPHLERRSARERRDHLRRHGEDRTWLRSRCPSSTPTTTSYLLLAWLAADGQAVAAGTPVAEVETSKAVEELTAATSGVLRHRAATGADITPGQVIALVDDPAVPAAAPIGHPVNAEGPTITAPARARMAELGVTAERVAALGRPIIRRADIDALAGLDTAPATTAATPVPGSTVDERAVSLSRNQRAVARTVTRSAATIPAAYTAMTIDVGAALDQTARLARAVRRPVGLAELFVAAIGSVHAEQPMCFARLDDDGTTVHPSGAAHVGVTVDLGEGLYVPVVGTPAPRRSPRSPGH